MIEQEIRTSSIPLPDPRYWGSQFWFTLHTVAYFYSDRPSPTEMRHAKDFYLSLASLLPCPGCAMHYQQLLNEIPIDDAITSRQKLMIWVNRIHNEVNRSLEKPIVSMEEYLMMNRHLEKPPLITYEPILLGLALAAFIAGITRYYTHKKHAT